MADNSLTLVFLPADPIEAYQLGTQHERARCLAIARKLSGRTYKTVTHIIAEIEQGKDPDDGYVWKKEP